MRTDAAQAGAIPEALLEPALTVGVVTPGSLDDQVLAFPEIKPPRQWYVGLAITLTALFIGLSFIGYTFVKGIGAWGNNSPVFWAFDIINFVFWVGIGHAGTLISAILFLFRKRWRNAIARFAEAMTIFAVMCAVVFPLIHIGRPWLAYWLFPYPNQRALWTNFRSPLLWDVFAVNTYFSVSLMFWYLGLIPDIASMRDRTTSKLRKVIYTILALGWRGAARHWQHYEKAYLLLAGLATGLVLSVHSVVSFDFATSVVPGWHMTIFPPYFVAGAIFAGFSMVVIVLVVVRETMQLKNLITVRHLDVMNKVILAMSCIMGYSYMMEGFTAWYSMNEFLHHGFMNIISGTYGWAGWLTIFCNILFPQILWFRKARTSYFWMILVALGVTVGMWFERFVIIVISLHQDYLPSAWRIYQPTMTDFGILLGTFGLFFTMVLLFARVLPVIATTEVKAILPDAQPSHHGDDHHV
ncbi:MAG: polysulfide reductase NrfD [Geothrix sp.]|uniref:NrfD/PsrC family molybdoenzyme membrane anchor subunit n=1 Tax=Geothrix sp. TaxID=1962974 RepID=UPI00180BFB4E|nr:NrfD/PsrC family molybdoenzyme membrane anchor subunit [Geothrix sp.]NWJ41677.1 polysulfide reductase NrfD [Geothrix sp.]WIL20342.1 MAG: polysulfide reductase NrfD [Geothrix sp.]